MKLVLFQLEIFINSIGRKRKKNPNKKYRAGIWSKLQINFARFRGVKVRREQGPEKFLQKGFTPESK